MPGLSKPCTKAVEPAFFAVGEAIEYEVYTKNMKLIRNKSSISIASCGPALGPPCVLRGHARARVTQHGTGGAPGALTGRFRQGDPLAPAIVQEAAGQKPQREDHEHRDDDDVVEVADDRDEVRDEIEG